MYNISRPTALLTDRPTDRDRLANRSAFFLIAQMFRFHSNVLTTNRDAATESLFAHGNFELTALLALRQYSGQAFRPPAKPNQIYARVGTG